MNTYYQMHRSEQAALPSLVKNKETRLKMNGIVRRKKVSFFFVVVNVFLLLCCNSCGFDTNYRKGKVYDSCHKGFDCKKWYFVSKIVLVYCSKKIALFLQLRSCRPQCPRIDLNKRFLTRPKTTT